MAAVVPKVKLSNGYEVPVFGLGTWKSPPGQVYEAVKAAIDAGYRHIDGAYGYQNEEEVGRAIAEKIAEGVVTREELFVTSKCWNTFHKKERAVECCKRSLSKLGLDYLDLFLIHWPFGYKEGEEIFPRDENGDMIPSDIDFLETWEGLEECHSKGMVRSLGLSNFNSQQILRVLSAAKVKPVMLQVECHPYLNQSKLIEFCKQHDIRFTGYSPLGSPDRPWATPEDPQLLEEPVILEIAKRHNKTAAQILLRFQVQRGVITIPKSVTKERIISNIQVFDFELTPDDLKQIEAFNRDHRFLLLPQMKNHKHYPFNIPF